MFANGLFPYVLDSNARCSCLTFHASIPFRLFQLFLLFLGDSSFFLFNFILFSHVCIECYKFISWFDAVNVQIVQSVRWDIRIWLKKGRAFSEIKNKSLFLAKRILFEGCLCINRMNHTTFFRSSLHSGYCLWSQWRKQE